QDNNWIRTDARCMLDFGAIAKGYAIDRGIAILRKHGIQNAIINAGGDIRIIGSHDGKPWRIGLRHPRNKGEVLGTLSLVGDISIVTSGDYERYFDYKGKRYHHILNPQTGFPATASQSATVLAQEATLADAWSTALFVRGESGLPIMSQLGYAALTVDRQGRIHMNKAMKDIFNPSR
ncbi:MAG TPA: FAD:protein FMN transferase, partial [Mariprofundaceae bacterium]|nr:FAD:protein FMN transferase [Mariprofundaceae bacterium]